MAIFDSPQRLFESSLYDLIESVQLSVTYSKTTYHQYIIRKYIILLILFGLLIISVVYSISVGAAHISIWDVFLYMFKLVPGIQIETIEAFQTYDYIVWQLRMPRILMAMITGMALAGAGAIMQGILRNPLASPFTLGVSSGAAFGAALAIVLGTSVFGINLVSSGQYMIALNAFFFGSIAVLFVYGIARLQQGNNETLLLAGVAIGYLFSACVSLLQYFSNDAALRDLIVWLMGGFWGVGWKVIFLLYPVVFVCLTFLFRYSWDLNSLSSGEEVAKTLGVNVRKVRFVCLLLVTLGASATIAFTGIIGFIGLVAPHVSRIFIGVDNRFLIPCSCLTGAILLVLADTLARTVIAPTEIPVGILTSLIGAPFFIYILIKKRRTVWS